MTTTKKNNSENSLDATSNTIIKQLVDERIRQGLTQKELALKAGLNQGQLSRIENFECSPLITTVMNLAHALGKEIKFSFEE